MVLSIFIADQRILQSDMMRDNRPHPTKKWQSQVLPSLDDYLHAKNLKDRLNPSRDIGDYRILQSD